MTLPHGPPDIKTRPTERINSAAASVEPLRVVVYRCMRCGKRHRTEQQANRHARRCRCFNCDHYSRRIMAPSPSGFGCLLRKWRWADGTSPPATCAEWEAKGVWCAEHDEDDGAIDWCRDIPDYRKPVEDGGLPL